LGHGVIGRERGVQTLASARCADWLRQTDSYPRTPMKLL
jgi:hypothetical protein